MNEKKKNQNQIIISVLGVAILIVAVVGVSFAAFTYTRAGTKENTISTGTIVMEYTEPVNGISIDNAMPMSDATGKALTGTGNVFDFTVKSTIAGTTTVNYEVAAVKEAASTMANDQVRLYVEKEVSSNYTETFAPAQYTPLAAATTIGSPIGSMVIASGSHTTTTTDNYRLRMWMASDATITGTATTFTVRVNVYGKAS